MELRHGRSEVVWKISETTDSYCADELSFSPCHYPTDGLVYGSRRNVEIVKSRSGQTEEPVKETRQCTLDDEWLQVSNGRWVTYPFPDESLCPPMKDASDGGFRNFIADYTGDMPISCWHWEDTSQTALVCGEMHCKETINHNHRWITSLKKEMGWYGLWESYDCKFKKYRLA